MQKYKFFRKSIFDFSKWTKKNVQNRKSQNTFRLFFAVLHFDHNALKSKKIILTLLLNLKNRFFEKNLGIFSIANLSNGCQSKKCQKWRFFLV